MNSSNVGEVLEGAGAEDEAEAGVIDVAATARGARVATLELASQGLSRVSRAWRRAASRVEEEVVRTRGDSLTVAAALVVFMALIVAFKVLRISRGGREKEGDPTAEAEAKVREADIVCEYESVQL